MFSRAATATRSKQHGADESSASAESTWSGRWVGRPVMATTAFTAVDGVAVVTRMLNAATTHYTRTLARPGTALPSRPTPLSGSSAQWDSLTGNICELVANVASANRDAQKAFTQGGAVKSLIELVPILLSARAMAVASQGQQSLTLTGMTSTQPAALKRCVINRFNAEMAGEILQPWNVSALDHLPYMASLTLYGR